MRWPHYPKEYTALFPFFDKQYYLEQYPDVRGRNPLLHYIRYGWTEGRNPNRSFRTTEYLNANPDVRDARVNPFYHYILHGMKEGRPLSFVEPEIPAPQPEMISPPMGDGEYNWDQYVFAQSARNHGGRVYLEKKLYDLNCARGSKILLVSHELTMTGAPVVLLETAKLLKKQGYLTAIISPVDGPLAAQFTELDIPVVIVPDLMSSFPFLSCARLFHGVILNTAVVHSLVKQLNGTDIPAVWWLHEPGFTYNVLDMREQSVRLTDNIRLLTAGPVAHRTLMTFFPGYHAEECWWGHPPIQPVKPDKKEKFIFSLFGSLEENKGQLRLKDVLPLLTEEERGRIEFHLAGPIGGTLEKNPPAAAICKMCEENPLIRYLGEYTREQMRQAYGETDCLLCLSEVECGPMVVSEAMSCGIPVICSRNTGVAPLVEDAHAGYVTDLTPEDIAEKIRLMLKADRAQMGENGRKLYEQVFSLEALENRITPILGWMMTYGTLEPDGKLSIVIPTWNGGKELPGLLSTIAAQKGMGEIEIVAVDSGSTDNTITLLKEAGAKVITIPHEEFAHGKTRDLGASHTTGKYLAFMTQDIELADPYFLRKLMTPLLQAGNGIVSCTQQARADSDLFGRLQVVCHNRGITGNHLLERKIACKNDSPALWRIKVMNADLCNLLPRELYMRFRFRLDYAEDIDLTGQILEAGYPAVLLQHLHMIHSHNRPGWYHLRRGTYDAYVGRNFFHDEAQNISDSREALQRIADLALSSVTEPDPAMTKEQAIDTLQKMRDENVRQVAIDAVKGCPDWAVNPEHWNDIRWYYNSVALRYVTVMPDVYGENSRQEAEMAAQGQAATVMGLVLGWCDETALSQSDVLRELYKRCHCGV